MRSEYSFAKLGPRLADLLDVATGERANRSGDAGSRPDRRADPACDTAQPPPQRVDVARVDLQHFLPRVRRVTIASSFVSRSTPSRFVQRDGVFWHVDDADRAPAIITSISRHARRLVELGQLAERHLVVAAQIDDLAVHSSIARSRSCVSLAMRHSKLGHAVVAVLDVHHLFVDTRQLAPLLAPLEVDPLQALRRLCRYASHSRESRYSASTALAGSSSARRVNTVPSRKYGSIV